MEPIIGRENAKTVSNSWTHFARKIDEADLMGICEIGEDLLRLVHSQPDNKSIWAFMLEYARAAFACKYFDDCTKTPKVPLPAGFAPMQMLEDAFNNPMPKCTICGVFPQIDGQSPICWKCHPKVKAGEIPGCGWNEFDRWYDERPKQEFPTIDTTPKPSSKPTAFATLPNGTYTISLTTSTWITLEVKDWKSRPGHRVIAGLIGPDNERDFQGFGSIDPEGRVSIWKRFETGYDNWHRAVEVLGRTDDEKQAQAREAYAMKSGRCAKCGRKLTVPASIHRGVGPECATRL